jgi:hypothetical protein
VINNSVLLTNNNPIELSTFDEIIRNIIMYADTIWLPVSYTISHEQQSESEIHIKQTLKDLSDENIISFYALESDEDSKKKKAKTVISIEQHMELYKVMINNMTDTHNQIFDNLNDPEKTSRIIENRNLFWLFGIATLLKANISVTSGVYKKAINLKLELRKLLINSENIVDLFKSYKVLSLAHLNTKDILELRKKAKKLRRKMVFKSTVEQDEFINGEYFKQIDEMNETSKSVDGNKEIKSFVKDFIFYIAALLCPVSKIGTVISSLAMGTTFYDFCKKYNKEQFTIFMQSLSRRSK